MKRFCFFVSCTIGRGSGVIRCRTKERNRFIVVPHLGCQGDEGVANGAVRVPGFLSGRGRAPAAGADVQGAAALGGGGGALPPRAPGAAPGRHLHAPRAQLPRRAPAGGEGPEETREGRLRETAEGAPAVFLAEG